MFASLVVVPTANVAIACCRRTSGSDPSDLYPDLDAGPIQAALYALGATSSLVSWDDPRVRWSSFSHVLVRSTWDSVDRPSEYLEWTRAVGQRATLVNSAAVIEWGLDKCHQRQLAAAGVPVIPTTWIAPDDPWNPPEVEFVVKPAVSAGGRATARYNGSDPAAAAHVESLQAAGQTVMVQPYLSSIDIDGEVNIIFLDGEVSHAVLKRPVLTPGEGIVERPWERMAWEGVVIPSPMTVAAAATVVARVSGLIDMVPSYVRVDLVKALDGAPLLLEVEVIDPYLSLDIVPEAAGTLAAIVVRA